jgi:alpha-L-rhamnosidase
MGFAITNVYVEYQIEPIGLDIENPNFSWHLTSDGWDVKQSSCRITVVNADNAEEIMWDSKRIMSSESTGITYSGKSLAPCQRYRVNLRVWDNKDRIAEYETFFETGFMDASAKAWGDAAWLAAPRFSLNAQNRGVFVIESEFRLDRGSRRAGIIFGAKDFRLFNRLYNEYGLANENYIRYEINVTEIETKPATIDIYRVGYAPGDRADVPFASVILPQITAANAYDFHTLRIEVDGNNAVTYLNGGLIDGKWKEYGPKKFLTGRVLNPRGDNDVLTYPKLCEIGFFAGEDDTAYFKYYSVRNLRTPSAEYIRETPGGNLYGEPGIFAGGVKCDGDCFVISGGQITREPTGVSIPMFRSLFNSPTDKEIKSARLYITARGIYDCAVNGKAVTERLLPPGLTQYDKRMNYQSYDITELVQTGDNGIGVTLASGWWSDSQTFTVKNFNYFGDKEAFICKLVLVYTDKSKEVYVSNTREWKYCGNGPYTYASLFQGEHFDARKKAVYCDYSKPDFDASKWETPVTYAPVPIGETDIWFARAYPAVNQTEPLFEGGYDAPVYAVDTITAKNLIPVEPGCYIYDFGQEMAGVPHINLYGKAGTRVVIRYAEMLYPDMPRYAGKAGTMMVENYRDAGSIDIYICSGKDGGEVYQPKFNFHGYRYIEINGIEKPLALNDVQSIQYSSITDFDGRFTSSNALLDRFAENVKWSQLCNFINIPTDCPQRNERMGWAGDTHVFCRTALHNSNLKLFYERNLQAMADLQDDQGRFPEIAPIGGGFGGITYECASIFVLWELYRQYGDLRPIKKFYPGLKKYMAYMENKGLPGEAAEEIGPLGDWLAPEETDKGMLWNAFYYREADIMSRLATVIGAVEDALEYRGLAERVKQFWNARFIDPITGMTRSMNGEKCDTQCSYALPMEYGVMDEMGKAAEHLARRTKELGFTVGTGFFGTGLINNALSKSGYIQEAFNLMLQMGFPSWLFPVTQGATTIWEQWDSFSDERGFGNYNTMNSFNHYALGSVLSWMYEWILGIKKHDVCHGYRHFTLQPCIHALDYAEGSVSSPYGIIKSGWRKDGGRFEYRCEIPVNTNATLMLPNAGVMELGSGIYKFQGGLV